MDDHIIDISSNSRSMQLLSKHSQGNNEYNNQVHLIQSKLLKMGFDISMVNKVIAHYKINSPEEGIYYLVKTEGMWNHSFIPQQKAKEQEISEQLMSSALSKVRETTKQELCDICGELQSLHRFNKDMPTKPGAVPQSPKEMDYIHAEEEDHSKSDPHIEEENEAIRLSNADKGIEEGSENECGICLSAYENPVRMVPCNHEFCRECFSNYLTDKVFNNNIDNINCPKNKCVNQLKEEMFLQYLPDDYVLKYHAFKKKNEISKDPSKIFCPICDSYGEMNQEANQSEKYVVTCLNAHSFCCCGRVEHEGPCYKEGEETIQFIQSERIKKCPNCGFLIKKDHGCNHMTCGNPNCQYEFCWLCMRESLPDHYRYGDCQGMQFVEENSFLFRIRKHQLLFNCITKVLNFLSCLLFLLVLLLMLLLPMLVVSVLTYMLFVSNGQAIEMFQIRVNGSKKVHAFFFWATMTMASFSLLPLYYMGLSIVLSMIGMLIVRKIVSVLIGWLFTLLFGYNENAEANVEINPQSG